MLNRQSGKIYANPSQQLKKRAYKLIQKTVCTCELKKLVIEFVWSEEEIQILEIRADDLMIYSVFFRDKKGHYDITRDYLGSPKFHCLEA